MPVRRESLKSRITAEAYYNELFSLEARKKELIKELNDINLRLEKLNKSEICNDRKTIGMSRN
jgi:hypothetical protein